VEKGERVVGTNLMTGTELMTVSDLNVMLAEVDVDENDIILVKIGDTAYVEIDAIPNKRFKGYVIELGHSAVASATLAQTTTFNVKILLIDSEGYLLRPGLSCNVEILTETKQDVLSVPLQAVTSRDFDTNDKKELSQEDNDDKLVKKEFSFNQPKTIVFLKDGDKAKKQEVTIGISDMGFVEIVRGLKDKDTIVSGSYQAISKLLEDGTAIKSETPKTTAKK
jgi:HlyD family secretion protein